MAAPGHIAGNLQARGAYLSDGWDNVEAVPVVRLLKRLDRNVTELETHEPDTAVVRAERERAVKEDECHEDGPRVLRWNKEYIPGTRYSKGSINSQSRRRRSTVVCTHRVVDFVVFA